MKFTEKQIETLSQWEYNFNCAVKADWTQNPGRAALQLIHTIYTSATGDNTIRYSDNCQHCILKLMKACGLQYFADKEALIYAKNQAKAVEATLEEAKPVRKVTVKTGKKSAKKTEE